MSGGNGIEPGFVNRRARRHLWDVKAQRGAGGKGIATPHIEPIAHIAQIFVRIVGRRVVGCLGNKKGPAHLEEWVDDHRELAVGGGKPGPRRADTQFDLRRVIANGDNIVALHRHRPVRLLIGGRRLQQQFLAVAVDKDQRVARDPLVFARHRFAVDMNGGPRLETQLDAQIEGCRRGLPPVRRGQLSQLHGVLKLARGALPLVLDLAPGPPIQQREGELVDRRPAFCIADGATIGAADAVCAGARRGKGPGLAIRSDQFERLGLPVQVDPGGAEAGGAGLAIQRGAHSVGIVHPTPGKRCKTRVDGLPDAILVLVVQGGGILHQCKAAIAQVVGGAVHRAQSGNFGFAR